MRLSLLTLLLLFGVPQAALAFCGFYVAGGGAALFNNATQVVLMRDGSRTVLSMQNNYQGPPEDFAMVVPVPVVLQESDVKTLPKSIFDRVDSLAAPRLVEYWEQDPCYQPRDVVMKLRSRSMALSAPVAERMTGGSLGVTIEAKFAVGEYKILILSAKDSTGLETWLRQENYTIPQGAAALLRPYVQSGMKFFVAKVDVKKVAFKDGMAQLSPLRFHYDSQDFALPIRLGMMNSAGTQDLIVHILSPTSRYVVANYDNVSIPTNLDLRPAAKKRFGEFYAALFDDTLKQHPGAVVTEYAWDASSCDPCPTPALRPDELQLLGADVLWSAPAASQGDAPTTGATGQVPGSGPLQLVAPKRGRSRPRIAPRRNPWRFILTRLHARYGKGAIQDDLVFEQAPALAGGREFIVKGDVLEEGAVSASVNNFQARYAIRYPWKGPIKCKNPVRNRWGGPPGGGSAVKPAKELAFAPRGKLKARRMVRRGKASPQLLASAKAVKAVASTSSEVQPETGPRPATSGTQTPVTEPPVPVTEPPASATEPPTPVTEPPAPVTQQPVSPGKVGKKVEADDCSLAGPRNGAGGSGRVAWVVLALWVLRRRRRSSGRWPFRSGVLQRRR